MTRIGADFLLHPGLQRLLSLLEANGHQAYIVGGAVRNALLGEPVADVDLATSATPDQVIELTAAARLRSIPTGIKFGTVTVITEDDGAKTGFEVTTLRQDTETDGRHAVVAYSDDILEDAKRRDFTMNALYALKDGTVIDPVGGLPDALARRLRFVGEPQARIREDYLRILRFFRFHAWYGRPGLADPDALAAITALVPGMTRLSKERIGAEMQKLLLAPAPRDAVRLMGETGTLAEALPGAQVGGLLALLDAAHAEVADGKPDWLLRLAALGADDPQTALRLSRHDAAALQAIREARDWSLPQAAYKFGETTARRLALLRIAKGETLPDGWALSIRDAAGQVMPVTARDLMPGISGPDLGHALRAAEEKWMSGGFRNSKDQLIEVARKAVPGPNA